MKRQNKRCDINITPGFYLQCAFWLLFLPVQWVLALGVSVAVHELGHMVALRLMRVPINEINIAPSGVILQTPPLEIWKEILCALTGPACGLCLVLLYRWLPELALFSLFHSVYNLLPVYPADGGRILLGLCQWLMPSGTGSKIAKAVGTVTAVMLAVAGLFGALFTKIGLFSIVLGMGLAVRALKKQK